MSLQPIVEREKNPAKCRKENVEWFHLMKSVRKTEASIHRQVFSLMDSRFLPPGLPWIPLQYIQKSGEL